MALPKRILILTSDAGFGHRKASQAVAEALVETYGDRCQIDIVNPLDDKRVPFFLRDIQDDYDKAVRANPALLRMGYEVINSAVSSAIAESALSVLMFEVMQDIVHTYQPDAILITYPMYQEPLKAVFTVYRFTVPMFTVITDLVSVHWMWFNPAVDACLVPTEELRQRASDFNMPIEKIVVTGIPVHPDVVREQRDKAEIRKELGWNTDLTTILAVGSRRVEGLVKTLDVINHFGSQLQVAAACGNDPELYEQLKNIDWHIPVHLYEYAANIPTLMHASDMIISKAGGLIVTESLACGLPMLLVNVLPGQEEGNAEYVVNHGAGELALNQFQVLEVLSHWLKNDGRVLKLRAERAKALGKPRAAYMIADLLWKAAEVGPVKKQARRIRGRPELIKLLQRNRVHWRRRWPFAEYTDTKEHER